VSLRRIATAASTFVVAVVIAVVVPVSQLRTVSTQSECCCPDPDTCKCPDHDKHEPAQTTMKACHKTTEGFVAPVLPVFVAPAVELASAPRVAAMAPSHLLSVPHPAPPPRRPDAPS
jgi:hypothetical protein